MAFKQNQQVKQTPVTAQAQINSATANPQQAVPAMWFSKKENPYDKGYKEGIMAGFNKGFEDGYQKGVEEGFIKGHQIGYEEGEDNIPSKFMSSNQIA